MAVQLAGWLAPAADGKHQRGQRKATLSYRTNETVKPSVNGVISIEN